MSDSTEQEHGTYQLSKELVDAAYAQNELFDINKKKHDLTKAARTLDSWLEESFSAEMAELEEQDLTDEQKIESYRRVLIRTGHNHELRRLESTLALQETVVPGQFIASDWIMRGLVYEVGQSPDGIASSTTPKFISGRDYSRTRYGVALETILSDGTTVNIDGRWLIGHDVIMESVKEATRESFLHYSSRLSNTDYFGASKSLRIIGEDEEAAKLEAMAVRMSENDILEQISRRRIYTQSELVEGFTILSALAPEMVQTILDTFALESARRARGTDGIEGRADTLGAYLEAQALITARRDNTDFVAPSQKEILLAYLERLEAGEQMWAKKREAEKADTVES